MSGVHTWLCSKQIIREIVTSPVTVGQNYKSVCLTAVSTPRSRGHVSDSHAGRDMPLACALHRGLTCQGHAAGDRACHWHASCGHARYMPTGMSLACRRCYMRLTCAGPRATHMPGTCQARCMPRTRQRCDTRLACAKLAQRTCKGHAKQLARKRHPAAPHATRMSLIYMWLTCAITGTSASEQANRMPKAPSVQCAGAGRAARLRSMTQARSCD